MIFDDLKLLEENGTSFVLITIYNIRGSAPQDLGAKCIVTLDGLYSGTIGGGKIEAHAINYAQELLKNSTPNVVSETWNLQKDIGMTCGGEVSFIFEKFKFDSWPIVIFGAGHVSQELTRLLLKLKCQLTVVDPRPEWIGKLPSETKSICTGDVEEFIKNCHEDTYFICMTKGHASDVPKLKLIAKYHTNTPYVGVIGSHAKGNTIKKELREFGISEGFINKLLVPIGLEIGNNDPSEIAISICAQLLQTRDQSSKIKE